MCQLSGFLITEENESMCYLITIFLLSLHTEKINSNS